MLICIIGGGLAGLIAALTARGCGLKVALLEASDYSCYRAGEHLAAQGVKTLMSLGVPSYVLESNSVKCYEIQSAWGEGKFHAKDSILNPYGEGIILTRPDFDKDLFEFVRSSGAELFMSAKILSLRKRSGKWIIQYRAADSEHHLLADFIVNASGKNTKYMPMFGAAKIKYDNLIAITLFYCSGSSCRKHPAGVIKIEAVRDGWCYSTALKNGTLVVSLMTDSDVVKRHGSVHDTVRHFIASSNSLRSLLKNCKESKKVIVTSANTQISNKIAGKDWISVGDAAWSADPLSSQGMIKAINSSMDAVKTVNGYLEKDKSAMAGYERNVKKEFGQYLNERSICYRMEGRWRNEEFWKRRHDLNWQEMPINIHPKERIALEMEKASAKKKRIKQIVPAVDFDCLINALTASDTPCEAVNNYKRYMPDSPSDREIIVAVQEVLDA